METNYDDKAQIEAEMAAAWTKHKAQIASLHIDPEPTPEPPPAPAPNIPDVRQIKISIAATFLQTLYPAGTEGYIVLCEASGRIVNAREELDSHHGNHATAYDAIGTLIQSHNSP